MKKVKSKIKSITKSVYVTKKWKKISITSSTTLLAKITKKKRIKQLKTSQANSIVHISNLKITLRRRDLQHFLHVKYV